MTQRSHENTGWLPVQFVHFSFSRGDAKSAALILLNKISLIPEIVHTALKRRELGLATDAFSNYLD